MRKSRLDINDPEAPFRDDPKRQSRTRVRFAEGRRVVAAHVNLVPE